MSTPLDRDTPCERSAGRLNVAIVHDFLSQHGGAERVVLQFAKLFPDAPIFTAFYDPDGTFPAFRDHDVRPSPLQSSVKAARFRSHVLRYPRAFRSFDLSDYDAVLVSSSAFGHHVEHPNKVVYCHTPPRFLYGLHTYVHGRARPLAAAVSPALQPLRRRDRRAARGAARYLANSAKTARRIQRVYGVQPAVVPPPVSTDHLPAQPLPLPARARALVVSRLLPYKRVDVAIRACRAAGVPLTVVGEGPDRDRLEAIGGATTFVGRVTDSELGALMGNHSVVLVPGAEDFGLMPVEANYAGRPCVAFAAGGPRETITPGFNGYLVQDHDELNWSAAIRAAVDRSWDPAELRGATDRFSAQRFNATIFDHLLEVCRAPTAQPDPASVRELQGQPQPDRLSVNVGTIARAAPETRVESTTT